MEEWRENADGVEGNDCERISRKRSESEKSDKINEMYSARK